MVNINFFFLFQAQRSIRPVHSAVANLQHHVGHPSNQHHLQTQSMQFNTHTSQQQLSSPSHLKNQQSSSKVIDLTEDDDRQSDVTSKLRLTVLVVLL